MADSETGPFSLLHMFWGNLAARPLRGALTILAIAIQVVADGWKTYGHWFDVTDTKQVIKIHLEKPPKWY